MTVSTAPGLPLEPRPAPMTLDALRAHGTAPAVLGAEVAWSHTELADRAEALLDRIGPARRLLLVRATSTPETVVAIVAGLSAGHPLLLAPDDDSVVDAWTALHRPDVVISPRPGDTGVDVLREEAGSELHPELCLLLGTSGSTGAPRLVRLSRANVMSNADAIATYLNLTPADRGSLHLPLHYCYGLSVLTSHLWVGAGVVVSDLSVVDDHWWDLADRHGLTGLPGVPYTFDLLESVDFHTRAPATLRYVTQAGGKLAPDRVAQLSDLGRSHGWDLFVMYGQTEATARMAYLPPDLARDFPQAVGRPIPGGRFELRSVDGAAPDVGELVYAGPNVMMGYADGPADLGRDAGPAELATGDLARALPHGLYEIVGRRSRFAKVFGLRLDLDEIERQLLASGIEAGAVESDGALCLLVVGGAGDGERAERLVARRCGVPRWSVRVTTTDDLPRTAAGKVDQAAVARACRAAETHPPAGSDATDELALRTVFARLLDRDDVGPDDSFVGLGADSVTFVAVSTELSRRLGTLPRDWQHRSVAELAALAAPARRRARGAVVDTGVVVRALAILVVVATHADLLTLVGGAHLLLALAGFNLARFLQRDAPVRSLARAAWRVAVPSVLWIGALVAVGTEYRPGTALLLNGWTGADGWDAQWRFWFVEALVWPTLAAAALFAVPLVRRLEHRRPFTTALAAWAAAVIVRAALTGVEAGPTERYTGSMILWCLALGWLAARCRTTAQRLVVTALAPCSVIGFFGDLHRELIVAGGVLLLLWVPSVRLPRVAAPAVTAVAGASLSIYLTHWVVYPHLEDELPWLAVLASLAVGMAYHRASRPALDAIDRAAARGLAAVRLSPAGSPRRSAR